MTRRTREEFDSLYLGKAVHCDTEKKANLFLALADSVGYKWCNGKSLIEKNRWKQYKEETCYFITNKGISHGDYSYEFEEHPFDSLILDSMLDVLNEMTKKKELKTLYDDVLKLRNRLSNEGSGEVFEEDHLLLDSVLDLIEKEMNELEILSINDDDTTLEIEALINISVTYDELGMSPTIPCDFEEWNGHFKDVFKWEYNTILKGLQRLKEYEEKRQD